MTAYRCIGKRIEGGNGRGRVEVQCSNILESETPPYPHHPNWPYLCSQCANEAPVSGSRRPQFHVDTLDADHPNLLEEIESPQVFQSIHVDQDEQDRADMDTLQELDLF